METNICKIKFRRGVEKDRKNITPEEGEPIFTTDSHRLCIGDGETQGGIPITKTYFESDTDTPKMKGDFEYKGGNLYLYTSDDESVPVGGVASVEGKIGNGLESVDGTIQVKQGDGITINANGVSVNSNIVNAVNTITELDADVSALRSTAMKAPLAPIYNNAYAMYANINGKANIPIRIDDIKDTLRKVKDGVYTFKSNETTVINEIKTKLNLPTDANVQSIGVNNGCVLNYDNSIKFDYTNATYISDCITDTTGEGENIVTTYTLSTYEDIVPRFHVDSSGGTSSGDIADNSVTTRKIADGAVTENKLSSDLKDKIDNSSIIVDGSITYDKLSDDVKDKLLPDNVDYVIERNHDIQTIPAFRWNDNYTTKTDIAGFSFKIERWSRKWKSGLIENWGYRKFNRTEQIDDVPNNVYDNAGRGYLELLTPHTSINYNVQLCCEWNESQHNNGYTTVWVDPSNKYEAGGNKHKGWFLTTHIAPMLNYYTRGY